MKMWTRRVALVLTATTLGAAGAVATATVASAASPPACGTVITTNFTLAADMTCPTGDGLVVGAGGITIDLKGHSITGGANGDLNGGAGVRIYNVTNVVLRNGTINDFGNGVRVDTSLFVNLSALKLGSNVRGVDIANSYVGVVEKSTITNSGLDAVRLGGVSYQNAIRQNVLSGNTFGLSATDNTGYNSISQNTISGPGNVGISVFGSAANTTLTQNKASGLGDGLRVEDGTSGTTLSQNTATGNADNGIEVNDVDTTLTQNTATYNGNWGIYAPGATDGGGNKATGNGQPAQCLGVACSAP